LITVLSKQRSVLAWSRYVRNSGDRQREIERFFDSASGDPTRDWEILRKHGVTHVIEARGADRIHPQVLDRLALIIQTPSLTLYAVPATVAAPDGGGRK
jgi:hypothetical protein